LAFLFGTKAEEIGVQGIGEIASVPSGVECVGRTIQRGSLSQNKMFPRRIVSGRARARKRKILEMEGCDVSLNLAGILDAAGKCALDACLERSGESLSRRAPLRAFCLSIAAVNEPRINQHLSKGREESYRMGAVDWNGV